MRDISIPTLFICAAFALILAGCASSSAKHDQESETAPEGLTVLDKDALGQHKGPVSFERQVKPILESKCFACHSGATAPAGFKLESRAFAMTHGASAQRIVPGKPEHSRFLALSSTHKNVAIMPPVGNRLTQTESRILWQWIAEGAYWPRGNAGDLHVSTANLHPEH